MDMNKKVGYADALKYGMKAKKKKPEDVLAIKKKKKIMKDVLS